MLRIEPCSETALRIMRSSPLFKIIMTCVCIGIAFFVFLLAYPATTNKAINESNKYENVTATSYEYDKCRTAYLAPDIEDDYKAYKDVFEKLDTIFIGPMSVNTYNAGVDLYSKQSQDYKLSLNELITNLKDDDIDPPFKTDTLRVRSTYMIDNALKTYASNTKIYVMYSGVAFIVMPALTALLFRLPHKNIWWNSTSGGFFW